MRRGIVLPSWGDGTGCVSSGDAVGWLWDALPRLLCAGLWLNSGSGWQSSLLPRISPGASLTLPGAHLRHRVRHYLTHLSFFELPGPSGTWTLELHHSCCFQHLLFLIQTYK